MAADPAKVPGEDEVGVAPIRSAGRVAASYIVLATVWILGSDAAVTWLFPLVEHSSIQTAKGLGFVLVTGLGLFVLMWAQLSAEKMKIDEYLNNIEYKSTVLSSAIELARLGTWDNDLQTNKLRSSRRTLEIFGFGDPTHASPSLEEFTERVHPDDRTRVAAVYAAARAGEGTVELEYRVQLDDGRVRFVHERGTVLRGGEAVVRKLGVLRDVTAERRREQQLHSLAQDLVTAREEERVRLSRRIHDDFGQRVATLRLAMATARRQHTNPEVLEPVEDTLDQLAENLRQFALDVRPPVLHGQGLIRALDSLAERIARATGLKIHVKGPDRLAMSPHRAVHIYRVAQEALSNLSRHANATSADIVVSTSDHQLCLVIDDDGKGLDLPDPERQGGGLGLTTMRERATLLDGALTLHRHGPLGGARVELRVPVPELVEGHDATNPAGR